MSIASVLFRRVAPVCVALAVYVSPAWAQTTNLGTYSLGEVFAQLNGTATWSVAPGSTLPPGLSLRTEPDIPPFFAADSHAGIIGIATAPGTYTFSLLKNGASQAYQMKITALVIKDYWTLPDGFANKFYSYQFTALNAGGTTTWTPNAALPPGMTLSPGGLLSGTPSAGDYFVNVNVNDGVDDAGRGFNLHVSAIEITTNGVLPNATQNVPYSTSFAAVGGSGGYTFTANNAPAGLTLATNGTLSGTPTFSGNWTFNVTVTDGNNSSTSKSVSIRSVTVPLSLPTVQPAGQNSFYNFFDDCAFATPCVLQAFEGSGGHAPLTWTASSLPAGMTSRVGGATSTPWINAGNLELWGAPTALGTSHPQLTVTDSDGGSARNTFDVRVVPLRVWNNDLPDVAFGAPYSHHFFALGGRLPYTMSVVAGRLPNGLALSSASSLTVSGTSFETGNFAATFELRDADGITFRFTSYLFVGTYFLGGGMSSTVIVNSPDDFGTITEGTAVPTTQVFGCCAAAGLTWSFAGGLMPAGVTLSSSGVISGTPAPGSAGQYTFMVRATDNANSANLGQHQFTMVVTPLSVGSVNLPTGNVGSVYNGSITGAGGSGITFSLEPFQYLPPGLGLSASGAITGTPTAKGQYSFRVKMAAGANTFLRFFSISIYAAGEDPPLNLPVGPTFTLQNGVFTQQLQATGGRPPYTYSLTPGATPVPGMRVQNGQPLPTNFPSTVTGGFIGVLATTNATYSTSLRVTDSLGRTFDKAITLNVLPLKILSQTVAPRGAVGVPYSFDETPFGGTSYSWSATNLPANLNIDSVTGRIFGTPSAAGTFNPTIRLTDTATSTSVSTILTITIDPYAIGVTGVLSTATVGTPYSKNITSFSCGSPCTWTALSALPPGMTLTSQDAIGLLAGTPTAQGIFTVSVQVSGTNGTAQQTLSLPVQSPTPAALAVSTSTIGDTTVAGLPNIILNATGGTLPYTWSVVSGSGALPPGTSIQPGTALGANQSPGFTFITGRPMQVGSFPFTLRVTDALGATATRAVTWKISPVSVQFPQLPLAGTTLNLNVQYTQALLYLGGSGSYTFSTTGTMPPGLSLIATGVVTGKPTNTGAFLVPVSVTDTTTPTANQFTSNVLMTIGGGSVVTANFVAPSGQTGVRRDFTLEYGDTAGGADLATVWVWFTPSASSTASAANTCMAYYERATNKLFLLNDAGTAFGTGAALGSGATLQNSQCALDPADSMATVSGNTLTLDLATVFKGSPGVRNIFMYAASTTGTNSGWQNRGSWTVPVVTVTVDSVSPNSGSGASQAFTFQVTDTGGIEDVATLWAWFTAATTPTGSAANTCMAYFDAARDSVFLLNDAGTAFTSAEFGTGATLQNSQCAIPVDSIEGDGSVNTGTLVIPITFKAPFNGAKNVFMYASSFGGQNSGWQGRGAWTVNVPVAAVTANSVAPATGSGTSQTFALQYGDTSGATDLATTWVWFAPTMVSSVNSCMTYYDRPGNTVFLLNDAGSAWMSGTPGAAATLQNTQCAIALATTTVVPAGNTLTVNLPMTFKPPFAGAKNIFMYATGSSGQNSGWQDRGDWTVTAPALPVVTANSATPATGSGSSQSFALQYGDTAGAADLATAWVWFTPSLASSSANSCMAYYQRSNNTVFLLNDTGGAWTSGVVGSATTLQNNQCAIALGTSSAAPSGNTLTVNLAMSFKAAFAGAKNVFMFATNGTQISDWQDRGDWTVPAGATPVVTAISATPSSGSGGTQTFALQYGDTAGATDLTQAWVWFTPLFTSPSANSCMAYYQRSTNQVFLLNDAGAAFTAGTLGTGTLQNNQCAINLGTSTVVPSGNTLTVNLATTFKAAFAGAKNVFMFGTNGTQNSGWQDRGDWTVPAGGIPIVTADSATPNTGAGATQTFALLYGDTAGAADLVTTWVWFTPTMASAANSCMAYYQRATNQVFLLNDAGLAYNTGTLGSATPLQNNQCSINLAASSAVPSGNTLTVNLAMTFKSPAFTGAKNVFMFGTNGAQNSGWQDRGDWTVP